VKALTASVGCASSLSINANNFLYVPAAPYWGAVVFWGNLGVSFDYFSLKNN